MTKKFLLVASDADSLINFRGPLLNALMKAGLEVHAAAPSIYASKSRSKLESMGDYVSEDGCMTCSKKYPLKFTDQLSYDEFKLSGMCQECQDKVFTEDLGLKYYRGEAV